MLVAKSVNYHSQIRKRPKEKRKENDEHVKHGIYRVDCDVRRNHFFIYIQNDRHYNSFITYLLPFYTNS